MGIDPMLSDVHELTQPSGLPGLNPNRPHERLEGDRHTPGLKQFAVDVLRRHSIKSSRIIPIQLGCNIQTVDEPSTDVIRNGAGGGAGTNVIIHGDTVYRIPLMYLNDDPGNDRRICSAAVLKTLQDRYADGFISAFPRVSAFALADIRTAKQDRIISIHPFEDLPLASSEHVPVILLEKFSDEWTIDSPPILQSNSYHQDALSVLLGDTPLDKIDQEKLNIQCVNDLLWKKYLLEGQSALSEHGLYLTDYKGLFAFKHDRSGRLVQAAFLDIDDIRFINDERSREATIIAEMLRSDGTSSRITDHTYHKFLKTAEALDSAGKSGDINLQLLKDTLYITNQMAAARINPELLKNAGINFPHLTLAEMIKLLDKAITGGLSAETANLTIVLLIDEGRNIHTAYEAQLAQEDEELGNVAAQPLIPSQPAEPAQEEKAPPIEKPPPDRQPQATDLASISLSTSHPKESSCPRLDPEEISNAEVLIQAGLSYQPALLNDFRTVLPSLLINDLGLPIEVAHAISKLTREDSVEYVLKEYLDLFPGSVQDTLGWIIRKKTDAITSLDEYLSYESCLNDVYGDLPSTGLFSDLLLFVLQKRYQKPIYTQGNVERLQEFSKKMIQNGVKDIPKFFKDLASSSPQR